MSDSGSEKINSLLENFRSSIMSNAPELLSLFDIYASEARYGRDFIDFDLTKLSRGSSLLEVGAGSLLLSCQLVREGFQVSALDHIGEGFAHFKRLRELVLEKATELGCAPMILNQRAEELCITDYFDYAFSINVMEHVQDVKKVLVNVESSLRPAATYRFTCPNYLFPYDPHFNIPTVLSKKLTELIFKKYIFIKSTIEDANGTWNSINWVTVPQLTGIMRQRPNIYFKFNKLFFVTTLERIGVDTFFASRRSESVRILLLSLLKLKIHTIVRFIPVSVQPIIDCSLTKIAKTGVH